MDPEQRQWEAELHLTSDHKGQFCLLYYHHLTYPNFKNYYIKISGFLKPTSLVNQLKAYFSLKTSQCFLQCRIKSKYLNLANKQWFCSWSISVTPFGKIIPHDYCTLTSLAFFLYLKKWSSLFEAHNLCKGYLFCLKDSFPDLNMSVLSCSSGPITNVLGMYNLKNPSCLSQDLNPVILFSSLPLTTFCLTCGLLGYFTSLLTSL